MTNKLDNQLIVRIGLVVHANPIRKLYQLQPDGYLDGGPLVFGVPINSLSRDGKPSNTESYAPGDFVLYVDYESHTGYGAFFQAIILGSVPGTKTAAETERTELNAFLGNINEEISNYLADLYQDGLLKDKGGSVVENDNVDSSQYDYQGGIPDDFTEASDISAGVNTVREQTDYTITDKAGRAQLSLDSVQGAITESAPFIIENSFATNSRAQLIGPYLQSTKQISVYPELDSVNYLYVEQFGAYSYGKISIINDLSGVPQSTIHQRLDGRVDIKAKQGVSIEKDIPLPVRYTNSNESILFNIDATTLADLDSETSLYDAIDNWDIWRKVEEVSEEVTAKAVPAGFGELSLIDTYSTATKDPVLSRENKYVTLQSCIRLLPSGGLIIRDAWGSEIRLEGGNIQISAANNLTHIAGRDQLNILGGVYTINANEAIELGAANKGITLYGNECKIAAKTKMSLLSSELNILSEGYISVKGNILTTDINSLNLLSQGSVSIAGTQVSINGSICSLTSDSSALIVRDGCIQIGAANVNMKANLNITEAGFTVNNVISNSGKDKKVTTPNVSTPSIYCNGYVISNKDLRTAGNVIVHGTVQAYTVAATKAAMGFGIYTIKKTPEVRENQKGTRTEVTLSDITDIVKKCKEFFTVGFINNLKKIFKLSSEATTIRQPKFTKYLQNSCSPVTVENGGNRAYIYPGENFWKTAGMYAYQEDCLNLTDYKESKLQGAANLTLNKANVKEN